MNLKKPQVEMAHCLDGDGNNVFSKVIKEKNASILDSKQAQT